MHLVLRVGGLGHAGELFVLNMGAPLNVVDLAQDLIKLSGFGSDEMPIVFTGMQTGEKFVEDLGEQGAAVEATSRPDVLRVSEWELWGDAQLDRVVEDLCTDSAAGNRLGIEVIFTDGLGTITSASLRGGAPHPTEIV